MFRLVPRLGVDPYQLFSEVDRESWKEPDTRLPLFMVDQLMSKLEAAVGDPDIGLHIADHFDIPLDLLNFIVFNSPTLRIALENLCKYNAIFQDICCPVFSTTDNEAKLSLKLSDEISVYRLMAEGYLALYYKIITRLLGEAAKLDCVNFVHSKPDKTTEHERIFNTDISFNQSENSLSFNRKFLDIPIPNANPELLKPLELHAKYILAKLYDRENISYMVENAIIKAQPEGKDDIKSISEVVGLSSRSLQNKLKNEGTRYQDLLNMVKRKQAEFFLRHTKLPIVDIAFFLGYSEQSSFNRAFKRWTKLSPREYRTRSLDISDPEMR